MAEALLKETYTFVSDLLKNQLHQDFIYHNFIHTQRVLKSTQEIMEHTELSEEDQLVLQLSALLHDVGYTKGCEKHEEKSVIITREFLKSKDVDEKIIAKVSDCIMATVFDAEPENQLEKIIRDADASHFAKPYFEEASEYLRIELELLNKKKYSPSKWREENIRVLRDVHRYYTAYALEYWQPKKEAILKDLVKKNKKRKEKK